MPNLAASNVEMDTTLVKTGVLYCPKDVSMPSQTVLVLNVTLTLDLLTTLAYRGNQIVNRMIKMGCAMSAIQGTSY